MMLSSVASARFRSWQLAALTTTLSGTPRRSLTTCRLVPRLPRLVGSGPVASPPRGGRHDGTVGRRPVPAYPLLGIVPLQLIAPQSDPGAILHPGLEAAMAGGPGCEL